MASHVQGETPEEVLVKSYRETLSFEVPERMGFMNITPQVEAALQKSGVAEDRPYRRRTM